MVAALMCGSVLGLGWGRMEMLAANSNRDIVPEYVPPIVTFTHW